jgi:hypothetical protein
MKKLIKMSVALGNSLMLQALFASPISAQTATPTVTRTATPTATPTLRVTPTSSSSALPEAGTYSLTLLIVIFGLALAVMGLFLLLSSKNAHQTLDK